ncbi:hypothetical protein [Roseateles amylovorans]|uniref:Uncharacterized protein n=1 Tax=Roseateles amylovorans TaxID=2978473 RepID=A0ABY6B7K2_9BURK|nr:hypothetical protein [Roseateles amylovorans]UXH79535.1 hypothetical protein N4261_06320 [Roseateles amylovorans]
MSGSTTNITYHNCDPSHGMGLGMGMGIGMGMGMGMGMGGMMGMMGGSMASMFMGHAMMGMPSFY